MERTKNQRHYEKKTPRRNRKQSISVQVPRKPQLGKRKHGKQTKNRKPTQTARRLKRGKDNSGKHQVKDKEKLNQEDRRRKNQEKRNMEHGKELVTLAPILQPIHQSSRETEVSE